MYQPGLFTKIKKITTETLRHGVGNDLLINVRKHALCFNYNYFLCASVSLWFKETKHVFMNHNSIQNTKTGVVSSKARTFIFVFEITMILALLIVWLSSKSIQQSKSLYVLFFYSFPSEFLIGLIPHEPILLYYGRYYSPLTVALVSVIGTVLAEAMNYSVFYYVSDTKLFEKMKQKKTVRKTIELFNKAPFTTIIVAGFTPVPFFPVRFLVVMGHYSILKYMLGIFVSRAPRFYLLALIGYTFEIPGIVLIALFIVLILTAHASIFGNLFKKEKASNR